jgi:hypothetical protein
MRFSAHETTLCEYTIRTSGGLHVFTTAESTPGLLVGIAGQEGDSD